METKIINVFFGGDNLPYKDIERQVHFPVSGSAFLGASNTTKIRFYFDYIGDSNTTWVSVAKLPNGKQGSRVLPVASDENGKYAELELSNWYTQAKGDVYIALQGYQGGVEYTYDSETELYEISGTPTIQTTGSIKLAINYAPIGDSPDYNDEFSTYQDILALVGDKADVDNVYSKTEVDSALDTKVDKLETTGTYVYTHNGTTQGQNVYTPNVVNDGIVQRDSNGEINVPTTPSDNSKATSKSYVDSEISSGLATKQDRLVSGTNIKTINGQSILGSGDLPIQGGGSVEVDDELSTTSTNPVENRVITNELYNVRAELLGKSNSLSLSYTQTAPTSSNITDFKKFDGTPFVDMADFNAYVNGLILGNSAFNTQQESLIIDNSKYIIDIDNRVVRAIDIKNNFKLGQFNIYITQTGIPDRWFTYQSDFPSETGFVCVFYPLETEKVDLSGYATKTELSDSIKNLAQPYDSTTIYSIGDKVIYDSKLYSCLVNMSAAESWDVTHWMQITVASGFVDLDKAQVISGVKTIIRDLVFKPTTSAAHTFTIRTSNEYGIDLFRDNTYIAGYLTTQGWSFNATVYPSSATADLGKENNRWQNLYLSNRAYFGTSGAYIGATGQTFGLYGYSTIRTSGTFSPVSDATDDLGTSTRRYKDAYLSGQAHIGNAILDETSNNLRITLAGATAPQYLIASTTFQPQGSSNDNKIDLGGANRRWRDLYLSRYLTDGTNSVSVADLAALIAYAKTQGWIS